jgi:hypothetical protein
MESKKINQLATEMSPAASDLTIIGDPITGVSKKITLEQISSLFSSSISFYSNYASFPATGSVDTLYCAKDNNKLYLWSGSAYVQTFPSQALLDTYQLRSEKGAVNGYASLDGSGKVPVSQLPSSIMEYKGMWNAATNTPTLANGTGDTGDVYICNVAGTVNFGAGAITFAVGDYVIYSGSIWQRSSGAVGTVTNVAVTESGDALTITGSPITTSGTINIGFAGTSAQYVAGDGSLITFPTIASEAQNLITEVYNETGATLTKGTVVYINGGHGNLPTVTKALATSDSTSAQTYGIIQTDITNNNNGYVVVAGRILNIDTQSYAAGTQLYLSSTTAGTWTSTKQYAPAHLVYIGIVVRSHPTQGVIEIKIQNGYELDELHNVSAQTPSNNDGLFYESSTSLWKNKSIATVLGYTPANDASVVHLAGSETITGNKYYTARQYFEDYPIYSESGISLDNRLSGTNSSNSTTLCGDVNGLQINLDGGGYNHLAFASTTVGNTYTFPNATGTIALTSDLSSYVPTSRTLTINGTTYDLSANRSWTITSGVSSVTATSPLFSSGGATPNITIQVANTSQSGYLSSTDWNTFNGKQAQINGTGFVKASGTTISYDNSTYLTTSAASSTYLPLAGGTLTGALNGTSATFTSTVNINTTTGNSAVIKLNRPSTAVSSDILFSTNGSDDWFMGTNALGTNLTDFYIYRYGVGTAMSLAASTGAATFSSSVTSSGTIFANYAGGQIKISGGSVTSGIFQATGLANLFIGDWDTATKGITLNVSTGAATFSSSVKATGATIKNPASDGSTALISIRDTSDVYEIGYLNFNQSTDMMTLMNKQGYSASGIAFGTNNTERMRISQSGNVGIGTSSPQSILHLESSSSNGVATRFVSTSTNGRSYAIGSNFVTGTGEFSIYDYTAGAERMRITSAGDVCINTTTSGGYKLNVNGSASFGSVYVGSLGTGTVYSSSGSLTNTNPSDRRLKENINSISYGLNEILQLNPVSFDWKNDNNKNKQFGFIAQEVKEIMPEAIIEGEYLGLEKDAIYTALVNAIKELEARLKTLENK